MIWDACLARAVAAELDERLRGVRAPPLRFDRHDRVVVVRVRGARLTADLAPGRGWVVLDGVEDGGRGAEAGGGRGRGARGSGGGGRGGGGNGGSGAGRRMGLLRFRRWSPGVEALRDERVIVIRFRRVRGSKPHPALIPGAGDQPLERPSRRRTRAAGADAAASDAWPGAPDRSAVDAAGREDGPRSLARGPGALARTAGGEDPRAALLRTVEWTSPLNVDHLLGAPTPEKASSAGRPLPQAWRKACGSTAWRPLSRTPPRPGRRAPCCARWRRCATMQRLPARVAANRALERRLASRLHRLERCWPDSGGSLAARTVQPASAKTAPCSSRRFTSWNPARSGSPWSTSAGPSGPSPWIPASALRSRRAPSSGGLRVWNAPPGNCPRGSRTPRRRPRGRRMVGERWRAGEITRDDAEAFLERTAGSRPGARRRRQGPPGRRRRQPALPPLHEQRRDWRYGSAGAPGTTTT